MFYQLKKYFEFDKRNAILKKEIIGGLSTFLAMCYILAVNPSFMSMAIGDPNNQYIGGLFLGTAIVSFIATFLMGVISKVPLCQAPGMGLNVFFTFTVAMQFNLGYQGALTIVMVSGVLYFLIALTPLRQKMMEAFSGNFKIAVATMIGLFVAYIGVANMGIIEPGTWAAPSGLGTHFNNPIVIICIVSTFLLLVLHFLKVPFAIVIGAISSIIMLAIAFGCGVKDAQGIFTLKNYSDLATFGDIAKLLWTKNVWENTFKNPLAYVAILTFLFVNFFDACGTMYAVGKSIGLEEDNSIKGWKNWLTRANVVEGFTTMIAPVFGQSPVVSYVESNTGTHMGAKTGISAIITSFCFILAIVAWPILNVLLPVPITAVQSNNGVMTTVQIGSVQPITGPILVLVGILMISGLKEFQWKQNIADMAMLLFVLLFGVIGFSISSGIAWGMTIYTLINIIQFLKVVINEKKTAKLEERKVRNLKEIYHSHSEHGFNWIILVTTIISVAYIVIYGLTLAGVISFS